MASIAMAQGTDKKRAKGKAYTQFKKEWKANGSVQTIVLAILATMGISDTHLPHIDVAQLSLLCARKEAPMTGLSFTKCPQPICR